MVVTPSGLDEGVATAAPAEPRTPGAAGRTSGRVPAAAGRTRVHRRERAAALEWSETRLPVFGGARATGWLHLVLLSVCALALVYMVQTSGLANTGYDIQRLQRERADWALRNEQLRLELAKLRSLPWIEAEAVGRLGMQRTDELTYVDVGQARR